MEATTRIVEKDGSRLVEVRLSAPLYDPETERWFMEYLHKASGVAYMEFDEAKRRLVGYGVWEPWWEQFRFWLEVSIYDGLEK
jgi:hypothetical protein